MTAKDKAMELVEGFSEPIDGLHKYPMCFDTAKQCALICVDEILYAVATVADRRFYFYTEVKKEIEKL